MNFAAKFIGHHQQVEGFVYFELNVSTTTELISVKSGRHMQLITQKSHFTSK